MQEIHLRPKTGSSAFLGPSSTTPQPQSEDGGPWTLCGMEIVEDELHTPKLVPMGTLDLPGAVEGRKGRVPERNGELTRKAASTLFIPHHLLYIGVFWTVFTSSVSHITPESYTCTHTWLSGR